MMVICFFLSQCEIKNILSRTIKEINIIPINLVRYTTFTRDKIKFIDSFRFLNASLENLVRNLNESGYNYPILNAFLKIIKINIY